ncbi:hypothetical protein IAT38_000157 [Cryptococcus sp. DSM 104549]
MESQRPGRLPPRGLPILSGPPPVAESSTCRQCAKEFNPLWRRKHTCGHCGYNYCSTCLSDGQALMPRRPGQKSTPSGPMAEIRAGLGLDDRRESSSSGYEVESVCLFCLGMLQVTAAPVQLLRSLPLKRLKEYLAAYNISAVGAAEKEDLVQAVLKARNPATGCLSPEAESYFRRRSVPKLGGQPTNGTTRTSHTPARPPPPSSSGQTYASAYQRPPRPPANPYNPYAGNPPPPNYARPPPPRAQPQAPSPARSAPRPAAQARPPQPAPSPAPRAPPPPVPTILSLVSLPDSYVASLSIGTLKAILYENHVRVDFKQVLEKTELVARVNELVKDERRRLERQRIAEEQELAGHAPLAPTPAAKPAAVNGEAGDEAGEAAGGEEGASGEPAAAKISVPTGPAPELERDGLCVVCQDEEAMLASADCGHLCMCAHCSDLIMATSQECPLCRTRIVTKHRLIRIYRT